MNRPLFILLILFLVILSVTACAGNQSKTASQSITVPQPQSGAISSQAAQSLAVQSIALKIVEPDDESVVNVSTVSLKGTVNADADVIINGVSVNVDNGSFITMIELEEGPNCIEVIASDSEGHKSFQALTVIYYP